MEDTFPTRREKKRPRVRIAMPKDRSSGAEGDNRGGKTVRLVSPRRQGEESQFEGPTMLLAKEVGDIRVLLQSMHLAAAALEERLKEEEQELKALVLELVVQEKRKREAVHVVRKRMSQLGRLERKWIAMERCCKVLNGDDELIARMRDEELEALAVIISKSVQKLNMAYLRLQTEKSSPRRSSKNQHEAKEEKRSSGDDQKSSPRREKETRAQVTEEHDHKEKEKHEEGMPEIESEGSAESADEIVEGNRPKGKDRQRSSSNSPAESRGEGQRELYERCTSRRGMKEMRIHAPPHACPVSTPPLESAAPGSSSEQPSLNPPSSSWLFTHLLQQLADLKRAETLQTEMNEREIKKERIRTKLGQHSMKNEQLNNKCGLLETEIKKMKLRLEKKERSISTKITDSILEASLSRKDKKKQIDSKIRFLSTLQHKVSVAQAVCVMVKQQGTSNRGTGRDTQESGVCLCFICYERPKNIRLSPCGHTLCKTCADLLHVCPTCRSEIEERQPMFL